MPSSRIYKTEGIIIRRKNIGETDKSITVFTKELGKIKTLAKGIRKITSRRSGHLELFSHVLLTIYHGKSQDLIQEAVRVTDFADDHTESNLPETLYSYYVCELMDKLTPEGQKHAELFELLRKTIRQLRGTGNEDDMKILLNNFSLELLWNLGYLPRSVTLLDAAIIPFIERITERKLHTPVLLTEIQGTE